MEVDVAEICCLLFVVCCLLFVVCFLFFVLCSLLYAVCCCCLLFAVCCLLCVVCCVLCVCLFVSILGPIVHGAGRPKPRAAHAVQAAGGALPMHSEAGRPQPTSKAWWADTAATLLVAPDPQAASLSCAPLPSRSAGRPVGHQGRGS